MCGLKEEEEGSPRAVVALVRFGKLSFLMFVPFVFRIYLHYMKDCYILHANEIKW